MRNFTHWLPSVLGGETRSSSSSFKYCKTGTRKVMYMRNRNMHKNKWTHTDTQTNTHTAQSLLTCPTRSTLKYFPFRSKSSSFYQVETPCGKSLPSPHCIDVTSETFQLTVRLGTLRTAIQSTCCTKLRSLYMLGVLICDLVHS